MHKTGPNRLQNPSLAHAAAGINPLVFLRYVMEVSAAVIGSGAHVTMMAMFDNASGIRKAFMK